MLKIKEAVIVEGRYDKIKLSNLLKQTVFLYTRIKRSLILLNALQMNAV